jgi:hypothetical protein
MGVFAPTGAVSLAQTFRSGTSILSTLTPGIGVWNRWENLFANSASDYLKIGVAVGTTGDAGNVANGTSYWLGGVNNTQFAKAKIAAFAIYPGKPTAGEITKLNSAAIAMYGATVHV